MAYTYDQVFAADPANPSNIAQNASITIFEPGDGTMTPLTITDPDGQPLANPISVNANGFGSAFAHATLDRVAWAGGGFTGFFTSYDGMKAEAVAARAAAETAASDAGAAATAITNAAVASVIADAGAAASSAATAASNASASATAAANSAALVGAPADTVIATAINGAGTATKTALDATFAKVTDDTDLAFRALRSALDAGRSTAISWFGDSTGDSDGSNPADLRTPSVFLNKLATAYPSHRVVSRKWDDTLQGFAAPVIVQAGPSGARYAQFANRTMRHLTATPAQFTTGNLDLRVLVAMDNVTPSVSESLVTRMRKGGVAGAYSNDLQFELKWTTAGLLDVRHSQDGAAWLSDKVSTVAVPATAGVPIWVRATIEITPGTGFTVKFYTSPEGDGVTWTQLGSTVTGGGGTTTAMYTSAAGSFFEIGGQAWQPVNNALHGKIYSVQIRNGVNGPLMAPALPELWERYPDSSTTFGGSPTIHLINASRSGSAMSYHTDATRLPKETPDYGQALVIFNDSHNEVGLSGPLAWTDPYKAWVDAVTARLPLASVAVVLQNPHTSAWANETAYGESHKKRLDELRILAGKNRWGLVDLYTAFTKDSRGLAALIQSDGLHPEQIGYALAGQTVSRLAGIAS